MAKSKTKNKEVKTEEKEEQQLFHIIVGSDAPAEVKELIEEKLFTIQKQGKSLIANGEIKIIHLIDEEMKQVVETRIAVTEEETVQQFILNEEKRIEARNLAIKLQEECKKQYPNAKFIHRSYLKNLTTFSWNKFNSVMNTLKMFGFVNDTKGNIQFTIDDESADNSIVENINKMINDLEVEVERAKTAITDKEVKKKLTALKRKLSTKL